MLAEASGGLAAGDRGCREERGLLDLEVHKALVCAPVAVITGIAHLVPVLDLIQEALLGVSLIPDDVGELFQRLGSIQRGGVVAVAGKGLYGESVRTGDIVCHVLADLFQHIVIAAVHGLVVIGLPLAVFVPV